MQVTSKNMEKAILYIMKINEKILKWLDKKTGISTIIFKANSLGTMGIKKSIHDTLVIKKYGKYGGGYLQDERRRLKEKRSI